MSQQLHFQSITPPPIHANLGKGFEAEIDAANNYYRVRGVADVDHNRNEWVTRSAQRAQTFPPEMRAQTGNGRCLIMVRSNVDYTGGGRDFAVAFDAKETAQASIPLKAFRPDQIARLVAK